MRHPCGVIRRLVPEYINNVRASFIISLLASPADLPAEKLVPAFDMIIEDFTKFPSESPIVSFICVVWRKL